MLYMNKERDSMKMNVNTARKIIELENKLRWCNMFDLYVYKDTAIKDGNKRLIKAINRMEEFILRGI